VNYETDESGLQMSPAGVLTFSIAFVASVMVLHIVGRLFA
jgi:preprotein translocase subunit Sec61beta